MKWKISRESCLYICLIRSTIDEEEIKNVCEIEENEEEEDDGVSLARRKKIVVAAA